MNLLQTDTTLPYGFNSIHEKHSNPEPIDNIFEVFQIELLMINRFGCFAIVIVRKTLHQLIIQNYIFLWQCKTIFRFIIMLAITY